MLNGFYTQSNCLLLFLFSWFEKKDRIITCAPGNILFVTWSIYISAPPATPDGMYGALCKSFFLFYYLRNILLTFHISHISIHIHISYSYLWPITKIVGGCYYQLVMSRHFRHICHIFRQVSWCIFNFNLCDLLVLFSNCSLIHFLDLRLTFCALHVCKKYLQNLWCLN